MLAGLLPKIRMLPPRFTVGAVSVMISVLLTQNVGADPAVEALADEVRVTAADWIFAEDQEIGEPCRWSSTQP